MAPPPCAPAARNSPRSLGSTSSRTAIRCSGAAYRLSVRQVAADRHLALGRGPQDRVHLALDDAARIRLQEDFGLVARLHVAQLILGVKGEYPRIVFLDKAHHRLGRKLVGPHAGTQGEIRYSAIGRREMRGAFEVVFRAPQIRFRLHDLCSGLLFGGISGEIFALEIAEIALRLLEVGSFPSPSRGERGKLFNSLLRQIDPRVQCRFFSLGIVEFILQSLQRGFRRFLRRLERHRVDLKEDVAFLNRPVWLDRHLRDVSTDARHDRDDIIHRAHVMRGGRHDVHEENQDRQRNDRDGDNDDLAGDVPRQPFVLEENQPDDGRVDDEVG